MYSTLCSDSKISCYSCIYQDIGIRINGNKSEIEEDFPKNHSSILRGIPGIGNFFKSEGSFAKLRIDNQKSICCFGPDNTIIAITSEGSYYQAKIDLKKGGDCQIIKQEFLNEINKK